MLGVVTHARGELRHPGVCGVGGEGFGRGTRCIWGLAQLGRVPGTQNRAHSGLILAGASAFPMLTLPLEALKDKPWWWLSANEGGRLTSPQEQHQCAWVRARRAGAEAALTGLCCGTGSSGDLLSPLGDPRVVTSLGRAQI